MKLVVGRSSSRCQGLLTDPGLRSILTTVSMVSVAPRPGWTNSSRALSVVRSSVHGHRARARVDSALATTAQRGFRSVQRGAVNPLGCTPRSRARCHLATPRLEALEGKRMKTFVSIPHHDYPARARDFIEERLDALLKYYDRIVSLRAVCERQSDEHRVELVANVGHHATLVVDARAELLDRAVDEACSKMSRVLVRHRHKLVDRRRRGARASGTRP